MIDKPLVVIIALAVVLSACTTTSAYEGDALRWHEVAHAWGWPADHPDARICEECPHNITLPPVYYPKELPAGWAIINISYYDLNNRFALVNGQCFPRELITFEYISAPNKYLWACTLMKTKIILLGRI